MHGAYTNTTSNRQLDVKYLNENIQKQPSRVFLKKGVLKMCSNFTEEHSCRVQFQ